MALQNRLLSREFSRKKVFTKARSRGEPARVAFCPRALRKSGLFKARAHDWRPRVRPQALSALRSFQPSRPPALMDALRSVCPGCSWSSSRRAPAQATEFSGACSDSHVWVTLPARHQWLGLHARQRPTRPAMQTGARLPSVLKGRGPAFWPPRCGGAWLLKAPLLARALLGRSTLEWAAQRQPQVGERALDAEPLKRHFGKPAGWQRLQASDLGLQQSRAKRPARIGPVVPTSRAARACRSTTFARHL